MPRGAAKGERRGGRSKGTPNKFNADVKAMILAALSKKGGVNYLVKQAGDNPVAFLGLVGKVLPMTVQGNPDQPLETKVTFTWQIPPASNT